MQAHDRTGAPAAAGSPDTPATQHARAHVQVEFRKLDASLSSQQGLLAAVRFGAKPWARPIAPLDIDLQLAMAQGADCAELWYATGPVHAGRFESIRYAHDDHSLLGVIELDEHAAGGICAAAEAAYAAIQRFQAQSALPHLLRIWNYFDAINDGAGDLERYRQFCVGRARAMPKDTAAPYPAATAMGRQQPTGQLQIFWLAGREPGHAVENPRQVSAYHYPRVHGPISPGFSRATLASDGTLLVSGTASIVGHASQHDGDALEQLEETLRNLAALTTQAKRHHNATATKELLKVYLRDPALAEAIAARLRQTHANSDIIVLAADVCRRELVVEIEALGIQSRQPATGGDSAT